MHMRQPSFLKFHYRNVCKDRAEDLVLQELVEDGLQLQNADAVDDITTFVRMLVGCLGVSGVDCVCIRAEQLLESLVNFTPFRI